MNPEHHQIDVGVLGVGSMGQHHARVYSELPQANLVGVTDVDDEQARTVANKHGTAVLDRAELLDAVDAVSVVVPTEYHFETVTTCLDANVGTFVEKPVLGGLERASELQERVERADVPVQVGHIERFNPAVSALEEIIADLSVVSVRAQRLGPPPGREIKDSAVLDLMIHDIDIVLSLLEEDLVAVNGVGVDENKHATALLEFDGGTMASLTASRKTQRKVRMLEITAEECFIELDYLDQSIEIHRNSVPEYIEENGDVRFKHESIVERPQISNGEPLQKELESFVTTVDEHRVPAVTVADGLDALSVALEIEEAGLAETTPEVVADD
ncbi:Gfo/Idh/MocA family oxidoreductase [Halostagnicola sp. A-GB9-2]|uniref:Gfo/Idh/MocA family oxidoreductase n=1 Tax=Halostagnicola sp. A-GB9-2 TaxID=3048066 RepID=UPI0024BF2E2B|nr:Gfo/Idh/MocA family oxidoreductase [Halostagnicola sp. A-GB9-2]MDJ1434177.1 Gfo/Idh/MocA family oxidoreductase [Halostagnicola sp. A-GB9-2]